jgi:hypothetical protein
LNDFLGKRTAGYIFATRHDNNETYKTHKETFLRGGLQRYVCINIKFCKLSWMEGFFYVPSPGKAECKGVSLASDYS